MSKWNTRNLLFKKNIFNGCEQFFPTSK